MDVLGIENYEFDNDQHKGSPCESLDIDHDLALAAMEPTISDLAEAITLKNFIKAQIDDEYCKSIITKIDNGAEVPFRVNEETGVIERLVTGTPQVGIPRILVPRMLCFTHDTQMGARVGSRKMYRTLRNSFYWVGMAVHCYSHVHNCVQCAKELVRKYKNTTRMTLFPAKEPLADVAMNILGELIKNPRDNRCLLVIVDRYSKIVKTVPLKSISALNVARAFGEHWVTAFGIPKTILTDSGSKLTSRLMSETYRILGAKGVYTTTYHPQTNGHCERFNSSLLSTIRKHTADHPKDWDLYSGGVCVQYSSP